MLAFRSINPLYGAFLLEHLGVADSLERVQAMESVLGLPRPPAAICARAARLADRTAGDDPARFDAAGART